MIEKLLFVYVVISGVRLLFDWKVVQRMNLDGVLFRERTRLEIEDLKVRCRDHQIFRPGQELKALNFKKEQEQIALHNGIIEKRNNKREGALKSDAPEMFTPPTNDFDIEPL